MCDSSNFLTCTTASFFQSSTVQTGFKYVSIKKIGSQVTQCPHSPVASDLKYPYQESSLQCTCLSSICSTISTGTNYFFYRVCVEFLEINNLRKKKSLYFCAHNLDILSDIQIFLNSKEISPFICNLIICLIFLRRKLHIRLWVEQSNMEPDQQSLEERQELVFSEAILRRIKR